MRRTEQVSTAAQDDSRATQAAYRARMAEVVGLMEELWYLRRRRELGRAPGLAPLTSDKWREFAVMIRQMIHEEELLASAVTAARRAAAEAGCDPGLSTVHISPRSQNRFVTTTQEDNVKQAGGKRKGGVVRRR